jgi:hypothetical protein
MHLMNAHGRWFALPAWVEHAVVRHVILAQELPLRDSSNQNCMYLHPHVNCGSSNPALHPCVLQALNKLLLFAGPQVEPVCV